MFYEITITKELIYINILMRIDELRKARGWSVSKLATEAGLKQSTVANLYERNNAPTFPTLEKLCSAFGISFAEFFSDSIGIVFTKEQHDVLLRWDKLTVEQKKSLLPELIKKL